MARWRRADLDASSSPSTVRRPCSATQLICCFARERVDRDKGGRTPGDADRPRSRSVGRLCGITRRRLPNRRFRLPSLHLDSCPAHRERRATWAGRPGRLVRGKPQPKPYSAPRAACHRNTGPAAPARRRPRAAACRAIGRSPTKSDLVGWSFKCSPNADRGLEVQTPENGISLLFYMIIRRNSGN